VIRFATDFVMYFIFLTLVPIFRSRDQWTALHEAANNGYPAVCELLIAGKADVNANERCAYLYLYFEFELILCCILFFNVVSNFLF
jgi:hypothetical protein